MVVVSGHRRWLALVGVLLVLSVGTAVPALGQDGPTVVDALDGREPPTAAEIADSIRPIAPTIHQIDVGEPRSLRQEVDEGAQTSLIVASDVLFAFDSAELSPRAEAIVRDLAGEIGSAVGTVTVVGHTDSVGTDAYNQELAERRAEAVAAVLTAQLGEGVTLVTEGRGSREPVADESKDGAAAAARNRRVEIVFER